MVFQNCRFMLFACMILVITFLCCEPWVEEFEETEDAVLFTAGQTATPPSTVSTVNVMDWNIRFGAGRIPWFGDSCGDRVVLTEEEVLTHLQLIADKINEIMLF